MSERDWGTITRRGLIVGLGASVLALTELAYNLPVPADPVWQRLIARQIRRALLGKGSLGSAPEEFAVAYIAAYGFKPRDEEVVQRFLLSTDAFSEGRVRTQALNFVALYDPYVSPCYSPLSG